MQLPYLKQVLSAREHSQYDSPATRPTISSGTISRRCCEAPAGTASSSPATGQPRSSPPPGEAGVTRMGQTTTKDMTEETFREQYDAPIAMIDLKASWAMPPTNIPGVPGVERPPWHWCSSIIPWRSCTRLLPEIDAKPGVIKSCRRQGEREHSPGIWPPLSPMPR